MKESQSKPVSSLFARTQDRSLTSEPSQVCTFVGGLVVYFAIHVAIRTFISQSLELDESEQLVLTQKLALGYGPQPPLYTWVQHFFFSMFGVSVFSLALLKNLLLLGTYLFTYLNARSITGRVDCGILAAVSLLFIPSVAWESQRDLTHSVLVSAFSAATLFCFLNLRADRIIPYLLFGACAALGTLSKYNYAFFLVGLVVAALSVPPYRATVLNWRMGLAASVALVMLLPHFVWVAQHPDLTTAAVSKFEIVNSGISAPIRGLWKVLSSVVALLSLFFVIVVFIFWKTPAHTPLDLRSPPVRLLLRTWLAILGVIGVAIVAFSVSNARGRWLQPFLICAPVFIAIVCQNRLTPSRLNRALTVGILVAAIVIVGFLARLLLPGPKRLVQPFPELARQAEPSLRGQKVIIASTTLLAANLRLAFPDKLVTTPNLAALSEFDRTKCALVWEPTNEAGIPALFSAFGELAPRSGIVYVEVNSQYHKNGKMKLAFLPSSKL